MERGVRILIVTMNQRLSPAEAAYVRRFCYEVATRQFGPGSIFDYCRYHSQDLEVLATETDLQYDILEAIVGDIPQPDLQDYGIKKREDGSYLIDGQIPFYDFLSFPCRIARSRSRRLSFVSLDLICAQP